MQCHLGTAGGQRPLANMPPAVLKHLHCLPQHRNTTVGCIWRDPQKASYLAARSDHPAAEDGAPATSSALNKDWWSARTAGKAPPQPANSRERLYWLHVSNFESCQVAADAC